MRKIWRLALCLMLFSAGPARAAIILEFFQGAGLNDTVLNSGFQLTQVTFSAVGQSQFIQVALHQIPAGGGPLTATDGLRVYTVGPTYGPGFHDVALVPGINPTSNTPQANVGVPAYELVRRFQPFPANQSAATGFYFAGLHLGLAPSPTVNADGRMFLGTFRLDSVGVGVTVLDFGDPHPAPTFIDVATDSGIYLDQIIWPGGISYPLPVAVVTPVPEPSCIVLAGLAAAGAVGLRLRRKSAATPIDSERTIEL